MEIYIYVSKVVRNKEEFKVFLCQEKSLSKSVISYLLAFLSSFFPPSLLFLLSFSQQDSLRLADFRYRPSPFRFLRSKGLSKQSQCKAFHENTRPFDLSSHTLTHHSIVLPLPSPTLFQVYT